MRPALGKGLDALISEDAVADLSSVHEKAKTPTALPIERVRPNPKQPRKNFPEDGLAGLAASIKQKGILQPIVVSPAEGGNYNIIAGERRWRAAHLAGMKEIPVVVRSASAEEHLELALIENLQREDLNPIELAEGFKRLQDEFQMTQEAIAQIVNKDRSVVANTLRLLSLSEEIQQALREGKISPGHGRALVAMEDPNAQKALFERILSEQLTVRHVEEAARHQKKREHPEKSTDVRALEEDLQRALARKVEIHSPHASSHKGWIKLEFYSLDDFDHLVEQLKKIVSSQ
jgi:ParB family chromosome partitioning protein